VQAKNCRRKCSACHVFDAGGQNKVGPALWNVVNRPLGASEGYAYSDALAGFGGAWDYTALNAFLAKPKGYISGTKMNFAGLKKPEDRANLIAWMRAKADSPVALPSADDIAAEGAN
jgi:cytochrome c